MNDIVETGCGKIKGVKEQKGAVIAYKGIRYATADRWEMPKQVTVWDGIYDASEFGNASIQNRTYIDETSVPEKKLYYREFRENLDFTYSEDCLFLNIWTPSSTSVNDHLPVVLFIHGGVFSGGSGHDRPFRNPCWPLYGVIAVTINYRLGPLGFACLPEFEKENGHSGDFALYDQLIALKWVHDNIVSFGGDPDNITIMGQSAGAVSVQLLCTSPLSDNLFSKAVMSSGGGKNLLFDSKQTSSDMYQYWRKIMNGCHCGTLGEFRSIDAGKIFYEWFKDPKAQPTIDGNLITKPISDSKTKRIPYLLGFNAQDIVPELLHETIKQFCDDNETPVFPYLFDHALPGDDLGSWHSADLWYWFGDLEESWRPFQKEDYELSDKMMKALTDFARTVEPEMKDHELTVFR